MQTEYKASVRGFCAPQFESVRQAFATNLSLGDDVGGTVAVYQWGRRMVSLCGGVSARTAAPYPEDGLQVLWSVSKGVVALCVARLVQENLVDLEAPLARYWPEFGRNSKEAITVGQVLAHQAGLPAFDRPTTIDDLCDWKSCTDYLSGQTPRWQPGTAHGYHGVTVGYLVGEMIRRVSGMTVGQYFRKTFGDPLNLDLWIGLPETHARRVELAVQVEGTPGVGLQVVAALNDPTSMLHAVMMNPPVTGELFDQPKTWLAEIPAGNAIGNAEALARLYSTTIEGPLRCLDADTISTMTRLRVNGREGVLIDQPTRYAAGFVLSSPREPMLGPGSFGHNGYGGSLAFAHPESGVAFAYVCNRLLSDPTPHSRVWRLLAAVTESL